MSQTPYLTSPPPSDKMPPGIPYIVGNEAAERFSYYGMLGILYVYMTQYLAVDGNNERHYMPEQATAAMALFKTTAYFMPLVGAIAADWLLGKYRTIFWTSLVYCLGHGVLALVDHSGRLGISSEKIMLAGLVLIAIGAGGIKPCVSAHVGDQFGERNQHLQNKAFSAFYFSINAGSFIATLLTPWLQKHYGPGVAFGVPGLLMVLATFVFWLGRYRFVHIPPGGTKFLREMISREGLQTLLRLLPVYVFITIFWILYDQNGSRWVEQAKQMDLNWMGIEWLESQVQAINPILVLIYIPLFEYVIYPPLKWFWGDRPLRKVAVGMFLTAGAFAVCGLAQRKIDAGETPSIVWQLWAYAILTAAEVMVYGTGLAFSYQQAPPQLKSLVMAFFLLTVSLGNLITALVNKLIERKAIDLPGERYYWFFTIIMLAASVLFIPLAAFYRGKVYVQHGAEQT